MTINVGAVLTITEDVILTIAEGATMINNGTIVLNGTLINNGSGSCAGQNHCAGELICLVCRMKAYTVTIQTQQENNMPFYTFTDMAYVGEDYVIELPVSFEGAFSINYWFTPAYTPVGEITFYYWYEADFGAADVLTVENASGSFAMELQTNGQYRGDMAGIAAKDLAKAIYVAAVYTDGTTTWTFGVLGYSLGAYCASQASKGGTMGDLAMAIAVYGYHAKAYFS